ncbi:MAG: S-adenosylmethionine:tRNA ribosyltransferase-isomerase, partial [Oscillospiraceae bacterium]|nr:S-adenosylmethionine:tRNA ribosyltransferase-isomerase [Oscillospiraceae bacterium]
MLKSDFNFELPLELVAQTPLLSREQSRLLCMDRYNGELRHHHFFDLPGLLRAGDCLVLNDSRVLPARLHGRLETGGIVEVVLLHEIKQGDGSSAFSQIKQKNRPLAFSFLWECLVRPGRKMKSGTKVVFGNGELTATVKSVENNGNRIIEFEIEPPETAEKVPTPSFCAKSQNPVSVANT